MPVSRPTLEALIVRIVGDIDTQDPTLLASVSQNPMNVFARAEAAIAHGQYGFAEFLFKQALPTTAGGLYLDRWGDLLNEKRKQPTAAKVTIQETTASPINYPAGSLWQREDGTLYKNLAGQVVNGTANIDLEALEEGSAGSIQNGATLTLVSSIPGASLTVSVVDETDGEDIENDDDYRARILAFLQNPPAAGTQSDYIRWAMEVPGVGQAWIGPSTPPYVRVYVASNDLDDLVPDSGVVDAVQAYLDDPIRKPIIAIPQASAIAVSAENWNFTSLNPLDEGVEDAIEDSLRAFYAAVRRPGVTIYDTARIAAVQNTDGVVTFAKDAPTGDSSYGPDVIPILGTVAFPPS